MTLNKNTTIVYLLYFLVCVLFITVFFSFRIILKMRKISYNEYQIFEENLLEQSSSLHRVLFSIYKLKFPISADQNPVHFGGKNETQCPVVGHALTGMMNTSKAPPKEMLGDDPLLLLSRYKESQALNKKWVADLIKQCNSLTNAKEPAQKRILLANIRDRSFGFLGSLEEYGHLLVQIEANYHGFLKHNVQQQLDYLNLYIYILAGTAILLVLLTLIHLRLRRKTLDELRLHRDHLEDLVGDRTHELIKANTQLQKEVEERKQTETRLHHSNFNFETIFEATIPLCVTDLDFSIVQVNEAYCSLFNFQQGDLIGKKCYDTRRGNVCHTPECPVTRIAEGSSKIEFSDTKTLVDGTRRDVLSTSKPFKNLQGELVGIVENFQDITKLKQSEFRITALNYLKGMLLRPATLEEKCRQVTDSTLALLEGDFARIWITRPGDLCESGCIHAEVKTGAHTCEDREKCLHLISSSGRYTHINGDHRRVPLGQYKIGRVAIEKEDGFFINDVVNNPQIHDPEWAKKYQLVSFAGHRMIDKNGKTVGVLALFCQHPLTSDDFALLKNVSQTAAQVIQMAHTEEALTKAKNRAEIATRAKSEFLASMSHELRTPLNAVTGFSELLSSLVSDTKQKSYLEAIKTAGKNLLTLISDILDLSKIEAGNLEIHLAPLNLQTIFNEIEQIFSMKIENQKLELIVELTPGMPELFNLDEIRLRQILLNLVGNAVKFTSKGHIKISARCERKNESSETANLTITIEDTGVGIPESEQRVIFESFRQLSGQSIEKYGGTGLGLAISKRLVELMNGCILLESEPGKGSAFHIVFKDIKTSYADTSVKTKKEYTFADVTFGDATILIVDDIRSNRVLLTELIAKTQLRSITAQNGQEAVLMAKEALPDLILMDIVMPVMSGVEAAAILKSDPLTQKIPIVIVTAAAKKNDLENLKDEGLDGFLTKPISISSLLNELTRFLPHQKNRSSEPKAVSLKTTEIKFDYNLMERGPELLEILRAEIIPQLDAFKGVITMNRVKPLEQRMRALGQEHNTDIMINLANNLLDHTKSFNIQGIEDEMTNIRNLKQNLEETLSIDP